MARVELGRIVWRRGVDFAAVKVREVGDRRVVYPRFFWVEMSALAQNGHSPSDEFGPIVSGMRINLVQGHSAGGLLRQAIRDFGLSGEVRVVDDDLSVGPLHDDETRNKWWLTVYGSYPEAHQPSLYEQWQAIGDDLRAESELVLWSSNSARDFVFERMAAFMLRDHAKLFRVMVPPAGKLEGVGFQSPNVLARMESSRRALTTSELADWGQVFQAQLRHSSSVRVLQQGAVVAQPDNALDQYLLQRCPIDWTKWYRVIGEAMADCDSRNLIGDAYFSWRLRELVRTGQVAAQGDPMSSDGPKGRVGSPHNDALTKVRSRRKVDVQEQTTTPRYSNPRAAHDSVR